MIEQLKVERRREELSKEKNGAFIGYNDSTLAKEGLIPHTPDPREGIMRYPGNTLATFYLDTDDLPPSNPESVLGRIPPIDPDETQPTPPYDNGIIFENNFTDASAGVA